MALSPLRTSSLERIKEVNEVESRQPSKTYEFNFDSNDFTGQKIDDRNALVQYIRKALSTPRFRHLIYNSDYGSELESLIGADVTIDFLDSEIPRIITEALIFDDRIESVQNFDISKEQSSDELFVTFEVVAVDGYTIKIEEVL